jgi:hypothetical protein
MCLKPPRKLFFSMPDFKARIITNETDLQSGEHIWVER